MPAIRTSTNVRATVAFSNGKAQKLDLRQFAFGATPTSRLSESGGSIIDNEILSEEDEDERTDFSLLASETTIYPKGVGRASFRRNDGKKVTPHQWVVYDFILNIPCGKVSTYKQVCDAIGEGSPRSVGNALRNNPFAPFVPCHRVIASDLCLGGFVGEWGTEKTNGSQCEKKVNMLAKEGVSFSPDGKLKNPEKRLWRIPVQVA